VGNESGNSAFQTALASDNPLIRWAAQSAEISLQLIPQTFSVYVLKKIPNSRRPNWLETQSSNDWGFLTGNNRAQPYEATHRADSRSPRLLSDSKALRG